MRGGQRILPAALAALERLHEPETILHIIFLSWGHKKTPSHRLRRGETRAPFSSFPETLFRAGIGTWTLKKRFNRLPWRRRASPSTTRDEYSLYQRMRIG